MLLHSLSPFEVVMVGKEHGKHSLAHLMSRAGCGKASMLLVVLGGLGESCVGVTPRVAQWPM